MGDRVPRMLLVLFAAAALAAGAIAANVLLLGYADSPRDPVGRLSPRATITQAPSTRPPLQTTGDHHGRTGEERDD